jgi:hypothetical protein
LEAAGQQQQLQWQFLGFTVALAAAASAAAAVELINWQHAATVTSQPNKKNAVSVVYLLYASCYGKKNT